MVLISIDNHCHVSSTGRRPPRRTRARGSAFTGCTAAEGSGQPEVVASFYPLQYVAERVVGDHAEVVNLTAPGIEPHDVELSPRQTAQVSSASVVFHEKGLQPAVDQVISNDRPEHVVDAADVVDLHHSEEGGHEGGHDHEGADPHFWLDPTLLARPPTRSPTTMAEADPDHAADFRANNARLQDDLEQLDADFRTGLERVHHPHGRGQPRRVRLPRRALRPRRARDRRPLPRRRALRPPSSASWPT